MQNLSRQACSPIGLVSPSQITLTVISIPSLPFRGNLYRNILPFIGDAAAHAHGGQVLSLHNEIDSSFTPESMLSSGGKQGLVTASTRILGLYQMFIDCFIMSWYLPAHDDFKNRFQGFVRLPALEYYSLLGSQILFPLGISNIIPSGDLEYSLWRASHPLEQHRGILGPSRFPQEG